jgi:hypothetical protein
MLVLTGCASVPDKSQVQGDLAQARPGAIVTDIVWGDGNSAFVEGQALLIDGTGAPRTVSLTYQTDGHGKWRVLDIHELGATRSPGRPDSTP